MRRIAQLPEGTPNIQLSIVPTMPSLLSNKQMLLIQTFKINCFTWKGIELRFTDHKVAL